MLLIRGMVPILPRLGILEDVLRLTVPYLEALAWGTAPLMVFAAFRRYLQGVGVVKPITFALVTANLVNAGACWALVYGKLGLPRMGVEGSGWATCLARVYLMAVVIGAFAIYGPLGRRGRTVPRLAPAGVGEAPAGWWRWACRRRSRSRWRWASSRRPRRWRAGSTRRAWRRTRSCSTCRA